MKSLIMLFFLLMIGCPLFSQQNPSSPTKADYLEKRIKQNRAKWILLGGGLVMTVAGFAINYGQPLLGDPSDNDKGMGLFVVGAITTLASIPFFFAAHKNKKRAASFSLRNQPHFYPSGLGFIARPQPALVFNIRI